MRFCCNLYITVSQIDSVDVDMKSTFKLRPTLIGEKFFSFQSSFPKPSAHGNAGFDISWFKRCCSHFMVDVSLWQCRCPHKHAVLSDCVGGENWMQ